MIKKFLTSAALSGILSVSHVFAAGDFSANVLLKPPSAMPIGMAEAVSSLDAEEAGISSLHYNPASPARLKNPALSVMGQRGIAEDNYGALYYGRPTILGTFSAGLFYYSLGDVDLVNSVGNTTTVSAEKDMGLSVNYSEEFFGFLGTGISLKYLNSKLADSVSASAAAFDAGVQARIEDERISLGAAVTNVGNDLKYIDDSNPLPLTLRIGGSYRLPFENYGKMLLALDFVKPRESDFKQFVGVNYVWHEVFSFRGGYKIGQDDGKIHAGFGYLFQGIQFDYGITNGSLGQSHSLSFGYRFNAGAVGDNSNAAADARKKRAKEVHKIRLMGHGRKVKIAVLGLNALGAGENTAESLADELFLAFTKMPKIFDVVDSGVVRSMVNQSGVDLAKCTDVACLKQMGEKLGTEKIVTGLLSKNLGKYSLTVQMMDVQTGSIEVTEAVKAANMADMEYEIRSIVQSLAASVQ